MQEVVNILSDPDVWRIIFEVAGISLFGVSVKKYRDIFRIFLGIAGGISKYSRDNPELKDPLLDRVKELSVLHDVDKKLDKILIKEGLFITKTNKEKKDNETEE